MVSTESDVLVVIRMNVLIQVLLASAVNSGLKRE